MVWWALTVCSQANDSKGEEGLNQADRIDPAQHDGCIDVTIADFSRLGDIVDRLRERDFVS